MKRNPEQLPVPGVPPPAAPVRRFKGTALAADLLGPPCPVCGRQVSATSSFKHCTICRNVVRNAKYGLVGCAREPTLARLLEASVERMDSVAVPGVRALLESLLQHLPENDHAET